jgi:hypothetical protein
MVVSKKQTTRYFIMARPRELGAGTVFATLSSIQHRSRVFGDLTANPHHDLSSCAGKSSSVRLLSMGTEVFQMMRFRW